MSRGTVYFLRTKYVVAVALCLVLFFGAAMKTEDANAASNKYIYKVKTQENLNVRAKATSSSKKLGVIKKGKSVTSTKISGKWYKIKYKKKTGYIYKPYTTSVSTKVTYAKAKTAYTADNLNVRTKNNDTSTKLGAYAQGKKINVYGYITTEKSGKWYIVKYNKKTAYVYSKYVTFTKPVLTSSKTSQSTQSQTQSTQTAAISSGEMSDQAFEKYMTAQGFPASYKPYLRKLHKAHPKWVFTADKAGYTWSLLNKKAQVTGRNLIDSTVSKRWRSQKSTVYNSKTGAYKTFDGGRWYQATDAVIAYYLDPRNFLNDDNIYQFMSHEYNAAGHTTAMLKDLLGRNAQCFMNNNTYFGYLNNAGAAAKVNPCVIAAMIIEEQGWLGRSSLISGHNLSYWGYYNFFNIGAYTANGMTAIQRGLWYAKGSGTGETSYGRPWNTKYKAIKGGAMFYYQNYVAKNQNTYYTKKFNVMNGQANLGSHEYMTNVMGACEEGNLLRYAYKNNNNYALQFRIPVYEEMPAAACPRPAQ